MPAIHPSLWFDTQAMEAAEFYVSVFPNSRIIDALYYGDAGSVVTVDFELDGTRFTAINGGPQHYGFTHSVSFVIDCASAAEVDHYWDSLTAGGEEDHCGWLKDRFGLSWQVIPSGLPDLLGDPDPVRAKAATTAMFAMKKLDLPAMAAATEEAGVKGRVAVSKWIDAPADAIFELLTDPARHPEFDGSGMLRALESGPRALSAIGDEFAMKMHNEHMGNYVMCNRVAEYVAGRRIMWEPCLRETDRPNRDADTDAPPDHRWGYALIPTGPAHTIVTEVFDCTSSPEWLQTATSGGENWRSAMAASLDKIAATDF